VNARRRELVEELGFAHSEAARLSASLTALKDDAALDPVQIAVACEAWQDASDRTKELHGQLRSITQHSEEEEE
jgi:hypothetical protein